jgi:hypothetical protein
VPYFLGYARRYRRLLYLDAALVAYAAVFSAMFASGLFSWFWPVFAALQGFQARDHLGTLQDYRAKAWKVETDALLAGMSSSGLFELADAFRAMADHPPPGRGAKSWRAWHLDNAARLDRGEDIIGPPP